jgi:3-hydroxybutyryl-CoA dehydrogenase
MSTPSICVIGAGTMGSGIAQVAAQNGCPTILFDVQTTVLEKAKINIQHNLAFLVGKQKITVEKSSQIFNNISFVNDIKQCKAAIIIEAIIEKTEAKVDLFNTLASFNSSQTIFASNTSSLSISNIQQHIVQPQRVVGMHFFNPAPLMKLVEVVKGNNTDDAVVQQIVALCTTLQKIPVVCTDAPGFIVNRVARHYYLEAMKIVEAGMATIETVDAIMEANGFKMGPFKLMDLIGMDINLSVTQSMYSAFNNAERFAPAALQINKVAAGELGKKTGKGFYQY